MSELRRHIMMQQGGGSDDLFGFNRMYPKSDYQYPDGKMNILEYMHNHTDCIIGWRFADSDSDIEVKYTSGSLSGAAVLIYVENGTVVERTITGNITSVTIPSNCTDRIILVKKWGFYGYAVTGNIDCIVIASNAVSGDYTSGYGNACKQIFLHESVTTAMRSAYNQAIAVGTNTGGELDTCSLVFPTINSYSGRKQNFINNLNLTSVILRKAVGTIPWTNNAWADYTTPFSGCNNIAKVTMEWDVLEDIPQFKTKMFPTSAVLYVPRGTTSLYIAKGWNALAGIIEYD